MKAYILKILLDNYYEYRKHGTFYRMGFFHGTHEMKEIASCLQQLSNDQEVSEQEILRLTQILNKAKDVSDQTFENLSQSQKTIEFFREYLELPCHAEAIENSPLNDKYFDSHPYGLSHTKKMIILRTLMSVIGPDQMLCTIAGSHLEININDNNKAQKVYELLHEASKKFWANPYHLGYMNIDSRNNLIPTAEPGMSEEDAQKMADADVTIANESNIRLTCRLDTMNRSVNAIGKANRPGLPIHYLTFKKEVEQLPLYCAGNSKLLSI